MSQELTDLQLSAARMLQSDGFFTPPAPAKPIRVLVEKMGNIGNMVQRALGKLGLSVVVITPLAKLPEPDVEALELSVPLVIEVSEIALTNQGRNGTGKGALDVVVEILCLLSHRPHGVTDGSPRVCRFVPTETPFTLVAVPDERRAEMVYHVNFTAPLRLLPRVPGGAAAELLGPDGLLLPDSSANPPAPTNP